MPNSVSYNGTSSQHTSGETGWSNPTAPIGESGYNGSGGSATCPIDKTLSGKLYLRNYGFEIPSGSTIDGVLAEFNWAVSGSSVTAYGHFFFDEMTIGSELNGSWGGMGGFGGATHNPSGIFTADVVNNSTFGILIWGHGTGNGTTITLRGSRMTVYYTEAGGGSRNRFILHGL